MGGWAFHCGGFSYCRAQALDVQALVVWHTGSVVAACRPLQHAGFSGCSTRALEHRFSIVMAHGHSFPMACGIFPDQGSNLCTLHWQMDSYPMYHQGNPTYLFIGEESLFQRPAGQLQFSEAPVDRIINSCSCCNRGQKELSGTFSFCGIGRLCQQGRKLWKEKLLNWQPTVFVICTIESN